MRLFHLTIAACALGALVNAAACIQGGDFSSVLHLVLGLVFIAWGVSPFAVVGLPAWRKRRALWGEALLLVTALAGLGFSLFIYVPFAMRTTFDAQDGLVYLFVPFYELLGAMAAAALAKFAEPKSPQSVLNARPGPSRLRPPRPSTRHQRKQRPCRPIWPLQANADRVAVQAPRLCILPATANHRSSGSGPGQTRPGGTQQ